MASELGETPGNATLRTGKEKRITRYFNAKDMFHVDEELDTYRYGEARKDLAIAAFYRTLKRKGSKAARFFENQAIEEASQPTEEIPIVA